MVADGSISEMRALFYLPMSHVGNHCHNISSYPNIIFPSYIPTPLPGTLFDSLRQPLDSQSSTACRHPAKVPVKQVARQSIRKGYHRPRLNIATKALQELEKELSRIKWDTLGISEHKRKGNK